MSGVTVTQPDLTLLLDLEGVIQNATLSSALAEESTDSWQGRGWVETVGEAGSGKIRRMVEDARRNGVSGYGQLTQVFPSGLELPMEFTTVRLGGQAGLIAIGRSLQAVAELQSRLIAAQQAMEQDYWKLREVETRYRMLFDASHEAVLIVRVEDARIVEANPAAIRSLGLGRGRDLLPELEPREREAFQAMLARVRDQGRAPGTVVHLGMDRLPWTIRASLMSVDQGQVFLLQIAAAGAGSLAVGRNEPVAIDELIDRLPDGFVVIDEDGLVRRANRGFLDLAQVGAEGAAVGERIGRWLSRPGADAGVLLASLQRHGVVRRFATTLHGEFGTDVEVEISATGTIGPGSRAVGLLIRDVGARNAAAVPAIGLRTTLSGIIEQLGKTTLPKLINDATAMVESHCIEAALELANGSRTEAAELLGISRQALYKKLGRYDIAGV